MDPNIWSRLPTEIINRICHDSVRTRPIHPFAKEIKTLMMLGDIIDKYTTLYGNDAFDLLSIDLDTFVPNENGINWSVQRKWRSMTPMQRLDFVTLTS